MKKTTWAIIGLPLFVMVFVVLILAPTQKEQETIAKTKPYFYQPMKSFSKPWQPISSFSISGTVKSKSSYYNVSYSIPELDKKIDFLGEKKEGFSLTANMLKRTSQTNYH